MLTPEALTLEKDEIEVSIETSDGLKEYVTLARKAGLVWEGEGLYLLRAFIRDSGLRMYPLPDVEAYLDEKFGRPECEEYDGDWVHKWGWYPLRKFDEAIKGTAIGRTYKAKSRLQGRRSWYDAEVEETRCVLGVQYSRLIPIPVLKTVTDIASQFPAVHFVVADRAEYKTRRPDQPEDPFLAVLGDGIPVMVIERWDEPSFR